jgi:hypothetical protein
VVRRALVVPLESRSIGAGVLRLAESPVEVGVPGFAARAASALAGRRPHEVRAVDPRTGELLPSLGAEVRPVGYWLELSPGVVGLRSGVVAGWEAGDTSAPAESAARGPALDAVEAVRLPVQGCWLDDGPVSGRVVEWSSRSRARMVRSVASFDVGGWSFRPLTQWCLVTLTYPGDWRAVAPDGRAIKRHLEVFRRAALRDLADWLPAGPAGRALVALWKLEFQRRGAPHFHLLMPAPVGEMAWRVGRGLGAESVVGSFRQWVAQAWSRAVGAVGEEGRRHLLAGTAVDWDEGRRASADPKRMAIYFLKHSAPGRSSKEYQHRVPDGFDGVGRFWGSWGLHPSVVRVSVPREDFVALRRLLRGAHGQLSHVTTAGGVLSVRSGGPRRSRVRVARGVRHPGDVAPGVPGPNVPRAVRYRWVTRRVRRLSGGLVVGVGVDADCPGSSQVPGGWVLSASAPELAGLVLRFVASSAATAVAPAPRVAVC